jgi:hypothetical protein
MIGHDLHAMHAALAALPLACDYHHDVCCVLILHGCIYHHVVCRACVLDVMSGSYTNVVIV